MATHTDGSRHTTRWGLRLAAASAAALTLATMPSSGAPTAAAPAGADHAPKSSVAAYGNNSFDSARWGDTVADTVAKDLLGRNSTLLDPGSLYTIETAIGARRVWLQRDAASRQITGQGVSVALLDSGTSNVAGLNRTGKLTYGPDLSIEGNGVLTDRDTFGHGTHMAGIIAATDLPVITAQSVAALNPSVPLGVAPDAGLVSLKLATTDGSTDVSEVIAALNWVTEHQTAQNGSRIRVVNLSFGTNSLQSYQLDPLAAAAENAWRHGLVVVVSGGNDGPTAARLSDPAIDPYVLAVGASDGADSVAGWVKPTVASFSSAGTSARHVDVLAPGRSIVSLRSPGSFVDVNHPEGRVSGDTTGRLFRGSGTSQAAAVVSGAVALMLQAAPNATPDQVKAALIATATPVAASATLAGAGQINVDRALTAIRTPSLISQSFPISTGQGSLNAARGGDALVDANGVSIVGEVDVQGNAWKPSAWWTASSTLKSWSGGAWMGVIWTGAGWLPTVNGMLSARWSSARWSSARWSTAGWDSARWSSAGWSSARWSSARWSDIIWS
jgi:serine protease AprX